MEDRHVGLNCFGSVKLVVKFPGITHDFSVISVPLVKGLSELRVSLTSFVIFKILVSRYLFY